MEKMVELLVNADNVRMLVVIAVGFCGYVRLNMSFDRKFYALDKKIDDRFGFLDKKIDDKFGFLDKKIDGKFGFLDKKIDEKFGFLDKKINGVEPSLLRAIDEKIDLKLAAFHAQLKANDFAHLNNTIEALTFTLEKNKFLEKEDKEYIDGRLDR
ncbi:MAG: hypothetical protein LBC64_03595 [Fibromonadaceae bacterium]|jgi:hypothetical protein|nr:hypothetical protein [Fibromonadaceae bacterium]